MWTRDARGKRYTFSSSLNSRPRNGDNPAATYFPCLDASLLLLIPCFVIGVQKYILSPTNDNRHNHKLEGGEKMMDNHIVTVTVACCNTGVQSMDVHTVLSRANPRPTFSVSGERVSGLSVFFFLQTATSPFDLLSCDGGPRVRLPRGSFSPKLHAWSRPFVARD